jgi:flagellar P-ring protein precursor FlgI
MKMQPAFKGFAALAITASLVSVADARMVLKNICRVKGQDEVTLRGLGLVVGLKGTGDGGETLPTIRALAKSMEVMGMPLSAPTARGQGGLKELKDAKNVALVMVTATVPATGSQRGDRIDCLVSAIGAKSLAGGRLFVTPLLGPDVRDRRVYAMVEGQVELDDPQKAPTAGRIARGCRLEADFSNDMFIQDGKITLVLDKDYADFQVAAEIADLINTQILNNRATDSESIDGSRQARAVDQVRIEVPVPAAYLADNAKNRAADVVAFISEMLSMQVPEPPVDARVVINQRTGSIVISGDVELGASVVTHKSFVIEAGQTLPKFVAIDTEDRALTAEERAKKPPTTKLKALLEALNAVKAKPEDMIEIIKGLKRNGKLHAHVIFE